ncbi:MAG: glycosyltransferase family 4 protein [Anaerolineae bacterium]
MRILILSQWFDPEPSFKGLVFARELARRGHPVEVLTGFPNYPGGKLYPGYRVRLYQREVMDGIPVHRVALYPSHDRSGAHRMLNYTSFGLSAALLGTCLTHRPDVVYVYNLVTLGLAAGLQRLFRGARIVYDVQDLWPESVASSGMMNHAGLLALLERCCTGVYRGAAHLVTYAPGIREALCQRGISPDRVSLIYNWCDEQAFQPRPRDEQLAASLGLDGTFNVMFAGTMGVMQALDTVLDAAELLQTAHPEVRFVLVGGGVERDRLAQSAASRELGNVVFLPRRPMADMGPVLSLADALLVHLKDDPLFAMTIPSKTQAYLASGIPVIMGVRGDAADLVRRSGGGLLCEPENPYSLAVATEQLLDLGAEERQAMGQAGRAFYERELSFRTGVDQFEAVFAHLTSRPPRRWMWVARRDKLGKFSAAGGSVERHDVGM